MEKIQDIISILKEPVIIWKYIDKNIYCNNHNNKFIEELKLDTIIGKNIKDVYPFFSKQIYKNYKKTFKKGISTSYDVYYAGCKINSSIILIESNFILEKLDIIKVENHDILNDPFNMIIITSNQSNIYNFNFLFLRNLEYNRNDIINKNIRDIFTDTINFNNINQIINNNIITKNNKLVEVDLYTMKLNGIYDIIIMKDISTIKENIINNKILKNLDTAIVVFDKDKDKNYFETYKCIDGNKAFIDIFNNCKLEDNLNKKSNLNNRDNIINKNIIEIFDENIYFKIKKAYSNVQTQDNYVLENISYNNKFYDFNCFIIECHIFGIIIIDITNSLEIKTIHYAKNNFLMGIIDKLRKPIYGISSTLNILTETKLNLEQREYINRTIDYSHILSILINDFTDYANLKLNKLKIELEPFNIREEIDQFYDNIL